MIFLESVSQERQVLPQLLATDNAESNGKLLIFIDRMCLLLRNFSPNSHTYFYD
jgi:hypothetical protein